MGRRRSNQRGFSTVEVVLVLIIIVLVGAVGWFAYKANHKTPKVVSKTTTSHTAKTSTIKSPAPNPTASWAAYVDTMGKFSLRYPTTWVKAAQPNLCNGGLLLLGPDANSVGACGSENFGEVFIVSEDPTACTDLDGSTYSGITKDSVTVSGVTGQKEAGTVSNQGMLATPVGTKVVDYCFSTPTKTYLLSYNQQSTYPDVLSDFNLMVTQTLQFTN